MNLKEQIQWCKAQIKSGYEVIAILSILTRLQGLEKVKEPPHPYHNKSVQAYKDFLRSHKLPDVVEPRQGVALKELLPKLQLVTTTKDAEGAYKSLVHIFNNWKHLSSYNQQKKTLHHINNNLAEILEQIRNGKKIGTDNSTAHTATGRKDFGKL